jgi:hypothetical protein
MTILDLLRARGSRAAIFAALLLASIAAAAAVAVNRGRSELTYPVVVSGSHLDDLLGKEIDRIRLFACRQGVMTVIPMQIDQRDSHGNWVWSDIVWSEIAKQRPVNTTDDDIDLKWELGRRYGRTYDDQDPDNEAVLDNNDLLVFMGQDMGQHVANAAHLLANAAATVEIEIADPATGSKRWAYAAYYSSDPPPLSPVRYVHYEPDTRKVITPVYEMTFSKQHVGVMEQLAVNGVALLDRTKFRGSLRLGGRRLGRNFSFTENDIDGYVYGYINGPVRVVRRTVASVHFGPLLSSSAVGCDQFFYPYHSEIPVRLPVNFLVRSASLWVAADYHNSPFRRVYTNANRHPIELGGNSSERNLLQGTDNIDWVALSGDRVAVVSMLTVPEELRPFTQVTPRLLYDRRLFDPPQRYPGVEPEAGYLIETRPGFPSGEHILVGTYLYLPHSFLKRDAEKLAGLSNQRLYYQITEPGHRPIFGVTLPLLQPAAASRRE